MPRKPFKIDALVGYSPAYLHGLGDLAAAQAKSGLRARVVGFPKGQPGRVEVQWVDPRRTRDSLIDSGEPRFVALADLSRL